jgi:hypothetical protein
MTQHCISDYTACEYFTHAIVLHGQASPTRLAKACVSHALHQSETGKAIAPFLTNIACTGVF